MATIASAKLFMLLIFVMLLAPILMVAVVVYIYLFNKYTMWSSPLDMRLSLWKRINPNAREADFFGGYTTMLARSRYWNKPENVTTLSPAHSAAARVRKEINAHRSQ